MTASLMRPPKNPHHPLQTNTELTTTGYRYLPAFSLFHIFIFRYSNSFKPSNRPQSIQEKLEYLQWELWSGCDEKQNAAVCVEGGHIALPHPLPLGRRVNVDMFLHTDVHEYRCQCGRGPHSSPPPSPSGAESTRGYVPAHRCT